MMDGLDNLDEVMDKIEAYEELEDLVPVGLEDKLIRYQQLDSSIRHSRMLEQVEIGVRFCFILAPFLIFWQFSLITTIFSSFFVLMAFCFCESVGLFDMLNNGIHKIPGILEDRDKLFKELTD